MAVTGAVTLGVAWLQQKYDTKKRRAEKFEDLVSALYEHQHWLDKVRNIRVFEKDGEEGISPLAKVIAITTAYFPTLDEKVRAVDLAADEYELWMYAARQKKFNKEENYAEGYQEPWRKYLKTVSDLEKDLRTFAEKNLV